MEIDRRNLFLVCVLCVSFIPFLRASDEMTVYDLLAPESHQFAIRYDVSATDPGSRVYFNIVRPGSKASNEKVLDRATGNEVPFELVTGKEAKAAGFADQDESEETVFIKIQLPRAVPDGGEFRLRILKTYEDAKSYFSEGDRVMFERTLGIQRNVVILPAGYELVRCSVPVMVSTEDGRVKVSMVNDREDELAVHIEGRRLP